MRWLDSARAVIERWGAIREMRTLDNRDTQNSYWDFKGLIEEANEVLERDLGARAIEIWTRACTRFPNLAMKSGPALDLMLKLKLYDEAEALLRKGNKR